MDKHDRNKCIAEDTAGELERGSPRITGGGCSCHSHAHEDEGHSHGHEGHAHGAAEDMKSAALRLSAAFVLLLLAAFLPMYRWLQVATFLIAYGLSGWTVLAGAAKNIARGHVFDENFLMSIASLGAIALGDFSEAVAVMLFYGVGEMLQDYAVDKSRKSIASLMDIRPDHANVRRGEDVLTVSPDTVQPGETIIVKAGERIPLDGMVVSGASFLDTSALTGESAPREVGPGDEALSGCINQSGLLELKVTKGFGESTVSKILELVENASSQKAKSEKFITRFARIYTPIVVCCAAALAIVPPLVMGFSTFGDWAYRALSFLIISCPCALVISIPVGYFAGIGGASRSGVLIKGGNYLELLGKADVAVFDKTGTLTKGVFEVKSVERAGGVSEAEVLELAAIAQANSNHPIAQSILRAYGKQPPAASEYMELAGRGVRAVGVMGAILAGNARLMDENSVDYAQSQDGTVVYVALDGRYMGCITIADTVKEHSKLAISELKGLGVSRVVMLTGDNENAASSTAGELGITDYRAGLLPQDKVACVESLLQGKREGGSLVFVGDGINDAPVLAIADVGVAMGGLGSDAAIEASDVVLMTDDPLKLAAAVRIARRTHRIVTENIAFALGIKALMLLLSAFGMTSMWFAIFADVGVALLAVANALRAMKKAD